MKESQFPTSPELTEHHSAIDGIAKEHGEHKKYHLFNGQVPQNAVRSDVEQILLLEQTEFDKWYSEREQTTLDLIKRYETFASIPNLYYGTEKSKGQGMDASTVMAEHIETLKEGLEHLKIIKDVYAKTHAKKVDA